jgi:archaellum component FlaC
MTLKEAYEKKLEAQLDEWSAEIEKLKAKAEKAGADAQINYHRHIEELQSMQEGVSKKLGELKSTSDDAWEGIREDIEELGRSLGNTLKSAISRFQ